MTGWYETSDRSCEHPRTKQTAIELENRVVDAEACLACPAVRLDESVVRLPRVVR